MKNCSLIITDSGGIQEEATSLGKKTILVRETTERAEAIEEGIVIKAGTETMEIVKKAKSLLDKQMPEQGRNVFGDGNAAVKIVSILKQRL
jgi:UDP-N-acetylglucosamine 2-epimerase (non-hydrolysing)